MKGASSLNGEVNEYPHPLFGSLIITVRQAAVDEMYSVAYRSIHNAFNGFKLTRSALSRVKSLREGRGSMHCVRRWKMMMIAECGENRSRVLHIWIKRDTHRYDAVVVVYHDIVVSIRDDVFRFVANAIN